MICSFQPKTYAELAKYTAECYSRHLAKVHVCAADSLSSTITVYNYIKKDKNADLAIADGISDALDMCAKDDLTYDKRLAGELATAESVTVKDPNYVNIFSSDFAFSFANILLLITFIISYRLFADKLNIQQSLLDRVTVVLIIISCYLTICAILANYEEQVLLTGIKKNRYCTRCTKHYNFNIYVSLATDTLYLLLKGLVMKMLDFMQDMLDDIYPSSRKTWDNSTTLVTQESGKQKAIIQQLIAVVSLLFVSKAPFALHFIRAVCDLVTLAQYKSYDEDTLAYIQGALERMNIFKEEF
ncbi:hypothetical protein HBI65_112730 [Parastagonospora nodorum]|nr:hypothetical protein HBI65_112730 [Parastagonospora nodorum]